ncbi:hypothetical protein F5050DRAFT_1803089 [Lentinula boryana]|uniref:BAG domain-containing protein n=1 Tax=Lentinula boryana TaxID=40481 RepID=A0ABQ8QT67_9AGAR|nr:hypothetical protein F5050DRAFT_1803089 [Lentinula boryana]
MHLNIKWGKERVSFEIEDPLIPLRVLKNFISEWSHLPLESIKLIHSGAVLKDENAPLSSFRFRPNATIQVVGSADSIPPPPHGGPTQKSETSTISQIQEQLTSIRSSLVPSLEKFLQTLHITSNPQPTATVPPNSSTQFPPIQKEYARLSEMLLQSLLSLDAITVDREWEQARQERKIAVKEVQGYLDQLDDTWNSRVR